MLHFWLINLKSLTAFIAPSDKVKANFEKKEDIIFSVIFFLFEIFDFSPNIFTDSVACLYSECIPLTIF